MLLLNQGQENMKKHNKFLLSCSVFALLPFVADAAGTYYGRNYNTGSAGQTPMYNNARYATQGGQNYSGANYNTGMNSRAGYYTGNRGTYAHGNQQNQTKPQSQSQSSTGGFSLDAGLSHQFAWWKYDLDKAGSKLHYDDLNWNVFDLEAKYDFSIGSTMMRILAGGQYGMQYGDSTMVDDDITNGGSISEQYRLTYDDGTTEDWTELWHALSVGTSSGGDMYGFHAGIGLPDVWRVGDVRFTPSVGYRYFKYKLETKENYGLSLDTVSGAENYCVANNGETQCVPFVLFLTRATSSDPYEYEVGIIGEADTDGDGIYDAITPIEVPANSAYVDTLNSFYYYQAGVSHSYEATWAGPYLAMDMVYDISKSDAVNARFELGLPMYKDTADQPYRVDLQHDKSFEDKGGFGDAYHIGLGANWLHSLSDSVMLTVGFTFDYYHASGIDATTYYNEEYYKYLYDYDAAVSINDQIVDDYGSNYSDWSDEVKAAYDHNQNIIDTIDDFAAAGWQDTISDEIETLYKSMGIRIGIQAKF